MTSTSGDSGGGIFNSRDLSFCTPRFCNHMLQCAKFRVDTTNRSGAIQGQSRHQLGALRSVTDNKKEAEQPSPLHRVSKRIQPLNQEVNRTLKNQNVKMQRVSVALAILAVMGVVIASAEFREPEVYKGIKNFLPNYIGAGNYTEESKANQCYQCSPPV
ncbi:hypothetical protein Fcan01_24519 [Folsomia candida]|uniref:Uncharacterized protein n=1 Tax=Folsomia candida TaxID=158441 RepID=A0A226D790_FOLCA|nr:hypothetical protein Fcan01_24519 [Folsomia candida]